MGTETVKLLQANAKFVMFQITCKMHDTWHVHWHRRYRPRDRPQARALCLLRTSASNGSTITEVLQKSQYDI